MAVAPVSKPAVVVLGSIGSGKTTLMNVLSAALSLPKMAEETAANPFLPKLTVDPPRWCLPNQMWFLLEAHKTHARASATGGVADHSAAEVVAVHTPIFRANGWLTRDEAGLVDAAYQQLFADMRQPDLFIVLTTRAEVLMARVLARGRQQDVPPTAEYLAAVSARREQFLEGTEVPVLRIDSEEIDFRSGPGQQAACGMVRAAL